MKIFLLLNSLLYLPLLTLGTKELLGNFKECVVGTKLNMLEFDNDCYADIEKEENYFDQYFNKGDSVFPAFVFSKHNLILETKGYECKILVHIFRYSKDIFFNKFTQKETFHYKVSRSECLIMAREKECGNYNEKKKMECNSNNDCIFEEKVVSEFPFYFGTNEKRFLECRVTERIVTAQNLNQTIFHNSQRPCFAQDEVCFFDDHVVVWDKRDINWCSFERLLHLPELEVLDDSKSSIFFSKKQNYLFKLKKQERHCGIDFFLTTEGVYLAFYNNEHLKLRLSTMVLSKYSFNHFLDKDRSDLLLAENDFNRYKMYKSFTTLACSLILNTIQASINNDDTFLHLNVLGRKNIVVYINNGKAFVPTCRNISSIHVQNSLDINNCDQDIEILYMTKQTPHLTRGFIRANNIVTQFSSKRKNCDQTKKSVIVSHGTGKKYSILKRNGNRVEIDDFNSHFTELKVGFGNLVNLYDHHEYLVNGPDFFEKINEFFEPKETISSFDIANEARVEQVYNSNAFQTIFEAIGIYVGEIFSSLTKTIYFCVFCFGITLLFLLLLYFICKNWSFLFSLVCCKKLSRQNLA